MRRGAFLEAQGLGGRGARAFLVRIAKAGISGNGNLYPPAVLREAAPLFENARVYVKGDKEHLKGEGKHVLQLIGRMARPRFVEADGGELQAVFQLMEPDGEIAVKLREAWDNDMIDLMGFSMDVEGLAKPEKMNGRTVQRALSIDKVDSVDLIVEPGAGGAFINFIEAKDNTMDENDITTPDLEGAADNPAAQEPDNPLSPWRISLIAMLQTLAPLLLEGVDVESMSDEDLLALSNKAIETAQAQHEADGAEPTDPALDDKAQEVAAAAPQDFKEALRQVRMVETRLAMREAVKTSNLPQAAKNKLIVDFNQRNGFTMQNVHNAIKSERAYLAKFTESGKVSGLGSGFGRLEVGQTHGDKTRDRLDAFFDKTHKDHKASRSFREAYVDITGDIKVTGRAKNCDRRRMREALESDTFADVLGDSITRAMVKEYSLKTNLDGWRQFVDVVPVNDFRVQERTRFGGYGDLPIVNEKAKYEDLTTPEDEKATYHVQKRGGLEVVTLEAIKNDDVGVLQRIPARLARAAKRTESRFAFSFIKDNPVIYDGKRLFSDDHKNLGTAALSNGAFSAARLAMMRQKEAGSNEDLSIAPRFLLVPFEGEEAAFEMFRRDTNLDESFEQSLHPVIVPCWTFEDPNDWAAVADPVDLPTIEIGYLDGEEEPSLFVQDNPNSGSLFYNDVLTYKIRHIYGGNVLDYRGFYKSLVVNP